MGNESSSPVPSELPRHSRKDVLKSQPASLSAIAHLIKSGNARRIVVMTGAGVSVAAGIPDFRTPGTGLYNQLDELGLPFPEAVFHIDFFRHNPRPFYLLARRLFPGNYHPTDAHFFSVLLERKGLLLRHYTQNVDNLEVLAGVPSQRLVEAHGSFADVHCIKCGRQYPISWFREQLTSTKSVERCKGLSVGCVESQLKKGPFLHTESSDGDDNQEKLIFDNRNSDVDNEEVDELSSELEKMTLEERQTSKTTCNINDPSISQYSPPALKVTEYCGGLIKPDIIFFGEGLPRRFGMLSPIDLPEADLLIVMGTSLQVFPFAGLIEMANPFCPRLLINKEPVGLTQNGGADGKFLFFESDNYRDVFFEGECDAGVHELCRLLGWEEELNDLRDRYNQKSECYHWKLLEERQLIEHFHSLSS